MLFEMFPFGVRRPIHRAASARSHRAGACTPMCAQVRRPIYEFIVTRLMAGVTYLRWHNTNKSATVLRVRGLRVTAARRTACLAPACIPHVMASRTTHIPVTICY